MIPLVTSAFVKKFVCEIFRANRRIVKREAGYRKIKNPPEKRNFYDFDRKFVETYCVYDMKDVPIHALDAPIRALEVHLMCICALDVP